MVNRANDHPMYGEMRKACLNVIIVLAVVLVGRAMGQTGAEPMSVNYCDVVTSPTVYNGKVLSVEVILSPSEQVLSLYGEACVPREGYNVTTQAILPDSWESMANGKKLRAILKHGREAKVKLVGTFENSGERHGVGAARFRFSISQVNAVSRWRETGLTE
ncbi:MAG TPA: hypothetical protein VK812_13375 [Candidatus Binatus sp.]|jgi:hypothetical protein|nr:hypothetical protein [Candidatus Binatus sp.]